MQEVINKLTDKQAMSVISQVEDVFKSVPHLPKGLSEFFVKISPWLAGIFGVLGILGAVSTLSVALGMGGLNSWMRQYVVVSDAYFIIAGILQLVSALLLLMSFKPLKNRELTGWVLLFWNSVLGLVMNAVGVVFGAQGIIGAVISMLIGFYILFEMKPFYSTSPAPKE